MAEAAENAKKAIISKYTREAGVRNLERELATVCRKIARKLAEGKIRKGEVTTNNLHRFLGAIKFESWLAEKKHEIGIATGLAWTEVGGQVLVVEVTAMPGKANLILTGHLGNVMKESAQAALSYTKSKTRELGIRDNYFKDKDIHIHVPAGAIPKDGPSAGITMATALVSLVTRIPVNKNVGMTGEITLRGKVLEIGGLKEKVLAAHRAGLTELISPKNNKKDLEEIPASTRKEIKFTFAETMDDVLKKAMISDPFKARSERSLPSITPPSIPAA